MVSIRTPAQYYQRAQGVDTTLDNLHNVAFVKYIPGYQFNVSSSDQALPSGSRLKVY